MCNLGYIYKHVLYRWHDYIYICLHVIGYLQYAALLANCPCLYVVQYIGIYLVYKHMLYCMECLYHNISLLIILKNISVFALFLSCCSVHDFLLMGLQCCVFQEDCWFMCTIICICHIIVINLSFFYTWVFMLATVLLPSVLQLCDDSSVLGDDMLDEVLTFYVPIYCCHCIFIRRQAMSFFSCNFWPGCG